MGSFIKKAWDFFEYILHSIMNGVLKLFHRQLTEKQWESFLKFVKFCFVGVSNFLVYYMIYLIVIALGGNYQIGNFVGFAISVLNAFYWNNKYVFKKKEGEERHWVKTLLKTYASYAFTGLILTAVLLYVWNTLFHLPEWLGPILNLVITTPVNFLINKLWAFREKKSE